MQPDELPIKEVGDRQSKEIKGEENQAKQFRKKASHIAVQYFLKDFVFSHYPCSSGQGEERKRMQHTIHVCRSLTLLLMRVPQTANSKDESLLLKKLPHNHYQYCSSFKNPAK